MKKELEKLRALCNCRITITINDHRNLYKSVSEYLKDDTHYFQESFSQRVYDKMQRTDTIIHIQAYVDTPNGFHEIYHHDLELALSNLTAGIKERGLIGKRDKKGKNIRNGDILADWELRTLETRPFGIVAWSEEQQSWGLNSLPNRADGTFIPFGARDGLAESLIIIGNVHTNPELVD